MTVEIGVIIAIVGFGCTLLNSLLNSHNAKRSFKADVAEDASNMAIVKNDLKAIAATLTKLDAKMEMEMRSFRDDLRKDHDEIIGIKVSLKSLWEKVNS